MRRGSGGLDTSGAMVMVMMAVGLQMNTEPWWRIGKHEVGRGL